jgi:hypothetical protein
MSELKNADETLSGLEIFYRGLRSNVRPLTTLTSETAKEGQALAVLLLCLHETNLRSLTNPDPKAPVGPAFHLVDPTVYKKVRDALLADGGTQGDVAAALREATKRFRRVLSKVLDSGDNPYDEDPDKCPTNQTLENLQTKGLMNIS